MRTKKWISVLLAAVMAVTMLFAGSVTAGAEETASGETPSYKVYYTPAEYMNKENKPYTMDLESMKGYDQCVITGISDEEVEWIQEQLNHMPFDVELQFGSPFNNEGFFYQNWRVTGTGSSYYAPDELGGNKVLVSSAFRVAKGEGAFGFAIDQSKLPNMAREGLKKVKTCTVKLAWVDLNKSKYLTYYNQKGAATFKDVPFFECEFIYNDGTQNPEDSTDRQDNEAQDSTEDKYPSFEVSAISNQIYTGKARKPSVTVTDGDKTLKEGADYTVSYQNNKEIGTATCTVAGKGKYSWLTWNTDFQIVPKKTTLTAKKSGDKITLKWNTVKGAEKYQIYYREKGSSKYKKLATVSGSKTSCSASKLNKNKTYQFKIRSYAKSGGKKYYSNYSKVVMTK